MSIAGRVTSRAQCTDEDLAVLAQRGDEHAATELVRRYEARAAWLASKWFIAGADRADVVQEARIGLLKAIRDYQPGASSFATFARLCMERHVITAVKAATRLKHEPLTSALTGDIQRDRATIDVLELLEAPGTDVVEQLESRRRAHLILDVVRNDFSDLEREVVIGRANGESYVETALRLGLPVRERATKAQVRSKTVDNALARARGKILRALEADGLAA